MKISICKILRRAAELIDTSSVANSGFEVDKSSYMCIAISKAIRELSGIKEYAGGHDIAFQMVQAGAPGYEHYVSNCCHIQPTIEENQAHRVTFLLMLAEYARSTVDIVEQAPDCFILSA